MLNFFKVLNGIVLPLCLWVVTRGRDQTIDNQHEIDDAFIFHFYESTFEKQVDEQ